MVDRAELERQILHLLPPDGAPVLNRVIMTLVGRRLGVRLNADEYFGALDALTDAGTIGRLRAQGGKVYRVAVTALIDPEPSPVAWPEPQLMLSLERYLKTTFWRSLDLARGFTWKVIDTSMHGPRERWGRPDYTVVSIVPMSVLPAPQLDVYAFELKAEAAADITSVHQALAQTRMTHFGYLVWHLPEGSPHETRLAEIADQCRRHGIGLILIRDPDQVETWSIEADAERKNTPPGDVDAFLVARLSEEERTEIRQKLVGG
jgi:hypothetical protein